MCACTDFLFSHVSESSSPSKMHCILWAAKEVHPTLLILETQNHQYFFLFLYFIKMVIQIDVLTMMQKGGSSAKVCMLTKWVT